MKYLQKFEELINRLLSNLFQLIKKQFLKLVPEKFKNNIPKEPKPKIPIKERAKNIAPKLKSLFADVQAIIAKLLGFLSVLVIKIKQIEKSKFTPTTLLLALVGLILTPLIKLKTWFFSLSPLTLSAVMITGSIGTLTAISVYQSTSQIIQETSAHQEIVVEVPVTVRPKYHKLSDKQLVISNIQMPIYIENVAAMKTLLLEFTIESSNRYIISYFLEQEHLVRDRLNRNLEPVVPEFPLGDEGKDIIKNKIRVELNNLLKDMGVKGKIENVHFESIIAG